MEKKRKTITSVSLFPETIALIESGTPKELMGLSGKLEWLIASWAEDKGQLVQYRTDYERENESPVLLNRKAFRVCGWGAVLKGWDVMPEKVIEALPSGFRLSKKSVVDLLQALTATGYRTQLVEELDADLLEVWAADGAEEMNGCVARCRYRNLVERMKEVMSDDNF